MNEKLIDDITRVTWVKLILPLNAIQLCAIDLKRTSFRAKDSTAASIYVEWGYYVWAHV